MYHDSLLARLFMTWEKTSSFNNVYVLMLVLRKWNKWCTENVKSFYLMRIKSSHQNLSSKHFIKIFRSFIKTLILWVFYFSLLFCIDQASSQYELEFHSLWSCLIFSKWHVSTLSQCDIVFFLHAAWECFKSLLLNWNWAVAKNDTRRWFNCLLCKHVRCSLLIVCRD